MRVKALREIVGDYGRRRPGDVFDVADHSARILIHRNLVQPWPHIEAPRQPARETQAFFCAPEVKAASGPLVSCIIPTADRPKFLACAIRSFLGQEYNPKELLVLDDGREESSGVMPPASEIPQGVRIRYFRLNERMTVGQKRNLGVRLAEGYLIAHFDDDDVSAPDRLDTQVGQILGANANVVGYRDVVFADGKQRFFRMTGDPGYAAGTSLLYRRDWALENPFPEIQQGEDNAFISKAGPSLVTVPSGDRIIARIHSGNTVKKRPGGKGWTRLTKQEIPAWANI